MLIGQSQDSSDSGYQIASPTKIMWDDDIGGGFDENASLTISSITQIGTSNEVLRLVLMELVSI